MPVIEAIWISGNISYCDAPRKFHGKPVKNRPTAISSATHTTAQERVHRRRCPQLNERRASTGATGRSLAGICTGEPFAASLDSGLLAAHCERLIDTSEEERFRGSL